jgi:ABC-type nitrate/sulfonate/bicarbonate transport system permease component
MNAALALIAAISADAAAAGVAIATSTAAIHQRRLKVGVCAAMALLGITAGVVCASMDRANRAMLAAGEPAPQGWRR